MKILTVEWLREYLNSIPQELDDAVVMVQIGTITLPIESIYLAVDELDQSECMVIEVHISGEDDHVH